MDSTLKRAQDGFLWVFSGSIFLRIIGFSTTLLVLSQLSVYEYGLVTLVLSVVPALSVFFLPGFINMITVDMGVAKARGDTGEMKTIFLQYSILQLGLGFVAWAVVFFGANIVALAFEGIAPDLLRVLSFIFLITPFRMMMQVLIGTYQNFFAQTGLFVVEETTKFIMIVIGLLFFKWGPLAIIVAQVLSPVVSTIFLGLTGYKLIQNFIHVPRLKRPITALFGHGKWNISGSYANSFNQSFRLWIIKATLGTEAVGLFSVAQSLLSYAAGLFPLNKVVDLLMPQYAADKKRMSKFVAKCIKYQTVGYVALAAVLFVAVPPILSHILPQYLPAVTLFNIMLASLLISGFGSLNQLFTVYKKQKSLFGSYILKIICTAILTPILTIYFGLAGAALEHVITSSIHIYERYRNSRKTFPWFSLTFRDFYKVDELDKLVLVSVKKKFFNVFRT